LVALLLQRLLLRLWRQLKLSRLARRLAAQQRMLSSSKILQAAAVAMPTVTAARVAK
jgi:hypothetical protein